MPQSAKGWAADGCEGVAIDLSEKRSGARSLRIDVADSPRFVRQNNLSFRNGKRYRLSAWVKGEGISDGGLRIHYVHPGGRRHWHTSDLSGTFDWQKVEVEFANAREQVEGWAIEIVARFKSGRVWVDDVLLEEFPLPHRVFIDGHSVTGGVVPILQELGGDALPRGVTDRAISITRSPNGNRNHIRNAMPFDVALICSWALKPRDKDFAGEVDRKAEWKRWFAEAESNARVMLFHWQPWGLYQWPDGFRTLADDYAKVAADAGIPIVPTTLAFQMLAENAEDPQAMLRRLYFADYHYAGRVGNYVKLAARSPPSPERARSI